jgi:hypothetical protein
MRTGMGRVSHGSDVQKMQEQYIAAGFWYLLVGVSSVFSHEDAPKVIRYGCVFTHPGFQKPSFNRIPCKAMLGVT